MMISKSSAKTICWQVSIWKQMTILSYQQSTRAKLLSRMHQTVMKSILRRFDVEKLHIIFIRILNPILFQLFSPGCGHNECAHCDNDQNTSEASSPPPPPPPLPHHSSHPLHPPPLPPKPPWMRSSITRPRPLSYNETSSETTETSEHETVIYSKNVKLNNGKNSISEVNKIKTSEECLKFTISYDWWKLIMIIIDW